MTTADLEWLTVLVETRLERMRAVNEREKTLILRSAEMIATAQGLLSRPVPTFWSSRPSRE